MEHIHHVNETNRALELLTRTFHQTAGMTWMIKKGKDRLKALRNFTKYCVNEARVYNGAFITEDRNGVVLFFRLKDKRFSFRLLFEQVKVAFQVTGLKNAIRAHRTKKLIDQIRPKKGWHGWLLASDPADKQQLATNKIKQAIYKVSDTTKEPIFTETSNKKLRAFYLRMGFVEYHQIAHPYADCDIYFLRRDPKG